MERLDDLHFDQTITQHGGRVEAGGGGLRSFRPRWTHARTRQIAT
jgi:hypothetical protein